MLGLSAVVMAEADSAASMEAGAYQKQRNLLTAELLQAHSDGYTAGDLAPIAAKANSLDARPLPLWVGDRNGFYRQQAAETAVLRTQLARLENGLLDQARSDAADAVSSATAKLAADRAAGADEADIAAIQAALDAVIVAQHRAQTLAQYRQVTSDGRLVIARTDELGRLLSAENATLAQGAREIMAQAQGNVDAIAKVGKDALGNGRNDATAATWLKVSGLDKPYRSLERYGGLLGSADANQLALGAAGTKRYSQQIHDSLLAGMPKKAIVLSMQGQELWAYDTGKVVQDTLVTTGRPPDLATDIGPMKVLSKESPWKMHSPWPKGSPYWYPDTTVQMVVWFTNTGEGLHDAYWQSTTYGPGSQYGPSASHGCVHIPFEAEQFIYGWAEVGLPVIVIPGDGTSLQNQLAQKTTDDNGNPLTGPKGA